MAEAPQLRSWLSGLEKPPVERKNSPGRACRAFRRKKVHRDRDESRPRKRALHSREDACRQRLQPQVHRPCPLRWRDPIRLGDPAALGRAPLTKPPIRGPSCKVRLQRQAPEITEAAPRRRRPKADQAPGAAPPPSQGARRRLSKACISSVRTDPQQRIVRNQQLLRSVGWRNKHPDLRTLGPRASPRRPRPRPTSTLSSPRNRRGNHDL